MYHDIYLFSALQKGIHLSGKIHMCLYKLQTRIYSIK